MKPPISLADISPGRGALPERMGSKKKSAMSTTMIIAMIFTFLRLTFTFQFARELNKAISRARGRRIRVHRAR